MITIILDTRAFLSLSLNQLNQNHMWGGGEGGGGGVCLCVEGGERLEVWYVMAIYYLT